MSKKDKVVLDPVHGAAGAEMTDDDLAELNADTRGGEVEETQLLPEDEESKQVEELPETTPEPEAVKAAEPFEEPEIERLKRLGLYRPGLIESFDDLGKSYKHIEAEFSRRPHVEVAKPPAPDPREVQQQLEQEFQDNPVNAMLRVATAVSYGTQQEVANIRNELFYANNPDAEGHRGDIEAALGRYPGMPIKEAWSMVRGSNIDQFTKNAADEAARTERTRASQKIMASRERPGGVRTAPVSPEQGIIMAMKGKTGREAVDAMIDYLEKHDLGAKD